MATNVRKEFQLACLVELSRGGQSSKGSGGGSGERASCSGILLSEGGLVLTHASALLTSLSEAEFSRLQNSGTLPLDVLNDIKIEATVESVNSMDGDEVVPNRSIKSALDIAKLKNVKQELPKHYTALQGVSTRNAEEQSMHKVNGHILKLWKVEKFAKILQRVLPANEGWSFFESDESKDCGADIQEKVNLLMPFFLLLKLDNLNIRSEAAFSQGPLYKGQKVRCMGSPFGNLCPPVFMNCVSQGIIGNLAGPNNEVILTDARCIPGSEGGAVFIPTLHGREIAGMIVASLCWKTNEWVGLTVACSMTEILSSLRNSLSSGNSKAISAPAMMKSKKSAAEKTVDLDLLRSTEDSDLNVTQFPSVCLIECDGSWGSGVLLDQQGTILTCGHVVKFKKSSKVYVTFPERKTKKVMKADVVVCSSREEVFDVAILRVRNFKEEKNLIRNVKIAVARTGMEVVTVGHGCFGVDKELSPTLTKGLISRVVEVDRTPVIIQSSCAVHAGASGGALLTPDGSLVGILTCNSRDTESGASYPHVNMSVPVATIWPYIQAYLTTEDEKHLKSITLQNTQASDLWGLKSSFASTKSKL